MELDQGVDVWRTDESKRYHDWPVTSMLSNRYCETDIRTMHNIQKYVIYES
jgi:hypothetical protein